MVGLGSRRWSRFRLIHIPATCVYRHHDRPTTGAFLSLAVYLGRKLPHRISPSTLFACWEFPFPPEEPDRHNTGACGTYVVVSVVDTYGESVWSMCGPRGRRVGAGWRIRRRHQHEEDCQHSKRRESRSLSGAAGFYSYVESPSYRPYDNAIIIPSARSFLSFLISHTLNSLLRLRPLGGSLADLASYRVKNQEARRKKMKN